MSATVRPIHLPGTAALDSLRQRAQAALVTWAREWMSGWWDDAQQMVTVNLGSIDGSAEQSAAYKYEAVPTEAGCMWFRCRVADRVSFCRAVVGAELMSGPTYSDDWIAAVTDRAWDACSRALCSALLSPPSAGASRGSSDILPESLFSFGSGAVQLSCEALGLHVIADSGVWRSVPPSERGAAQRRPKLIQLDRAAHRSNARLEVMLGSVEVELPMLLDLHCGDVLRLPQRLDQGIVVLCEGKPLARAVLGETQGHKCVQVLANAQSNHPQSHSK